MVEHAEPIRVLALAVLKRATDDLTVTAGREASSIRRDAYRFLTDALWDEECLWRMILADYLVQHRVVQMVRRKVYCTPENDIVVLKS